MNKIIERKDLSGPAERAKGLLTFWGAYQKYKEACAVIDRQWGESTQEKYQKIVQNRLVPHLPNHDRTAISEFTLETYQAAIAEIAVRGLNDDPLNFVPFDEDTLGQYLHVLKTVVKVAAANEGFDNVFEVTDPPAQVDRIQRMKELWITPKSFSVQEEWKVIRYILRNIDERGETVALFLMYCLGLRNEEACAVNFGHIFEMEAYPGNYYITVPQSTHIHRNETKLEVKTYNGYRYIPLPSLAVKVIINLKEKRIQYLEKKNSSVPIDKMPIAFRGKDQLIRCGADAVTRQAQKMFEELGMRESLRKVAEYLHQDIEVAIEEQADVDEFALIEKQPTAYLLRRNFATAMAIVQLTEAELEYVLGHVIEDPQVKRSDFSDEHELYAIKEKMDQRPIVNDILSHPSEVLDSNSVVKFSAYSQDFVPVYGASKIKGSATAKEPGDSITVTVVQRNGTAISESTTTYGMPFPKKYPRSADVLRAYHEAFTKNSDDPQWECPPTE